MTRDKKAKKIAHALKNSAGISYTSARRAAGLYQRIGSPHAERVGGTLRFHGR